MIYPYVLVYNNPEKSYVWANGYNDIISVQATREKMIHLEFRDREHFTILENVDPKEIVKELTK